MPVPSTIRDVFDHFQNLNLLALLHDLRVGRAARHGWLSGSLLCPVAHALRSGRQVREASALGQAAGFRDDCAYVASHLGADPGAVYRFVRSWDEGAYGNAWLVRQLEDLWAERLADADLMQDLLASSPPIGHDIEGDGMLLKIHV